MTETSNEAVTAVWELCFPGINREETIAWCADHGLDATQILENGSRVLQRGNTLIFEYDEMVRDEDGHPVLRGEEIARRHRQVEVNTEPPASEWVKR